MADILTQSLILQEAASNIIRVYRNVPRDPDCLYETERNALLFTWFARGSKAPLRDPEADKRAIEKIINGSGPEGSRVTERQAKNAIAVYYNASPEERSDIDNITR